MSRVDVYIYLDPHGVAIVTSKRLRKTRYSFDFQGARANYFVAFARNHAPVVAHNALGFECLCVEIKLGGNARDVRYLKSRGPRRARELPLDDDGKVQGRLF